MPKTEQRGKYTGVLAQPIKMGPISNGLLRPYGGEERWLKTLAEKRARKVNALFAHYGIDPDVPGAAAELAMRLAVTHVPGFQPTQKRGAKPKDGFNLWARVHLKLLESKGQLSVAAVCKILTRKRPEPEKAANTMRRRYTAANKRYGALVAELPADEFRAMLERVSQAPAKAG